MAVCSEQLEDVCMWEQNVNHHGDVDSNDSIAQLTSAQKVVVLRR